MKKKYKLIKSYPGSPELGTIWDENTEIVGLISNEKEWQENKTSIEYCSEFWQIDE